MKTPVPLPIEELAEQGTEWAIEELSRRAKIERTKRIEAFIWRRDRYRDQLEARLPTTDSAETYAAILAYIQALRDIPEQPGFPINIEWPKEP